MIRYALAAVGFAAAALFAPRPAAASTSCAVKALPIAGTYAATRKLHGPGLWLAGSGTIDKPIAALTWVRDTIAGPRKGRAGNVVVLRDADTPDVVRLSSAYRESGFASMQELLIPRCASAAQLTRVARYVDRADVVFFAGDDESPDAAWSGAPIVAAVERVYARGGVVGGGGAGLAIQGAVAYDSSQADLVLDPLGARVGLSAGPFAWPALRDTVVDAQFVKRDRFGRLAALLALIRSSNLLGRAWPAYGLGIDEDSDVMVGPNGVATVYNEGGGLGAYLLRASAMPALERGKPLRYEIDLVHLARSGERFDLLHKRAAEAWTPVPVNGAATPAYDSGVYRL